MKSLIIAIIVFLVTISICTASYFLATTFADKMTADLETIKIALEKEDLSVALKFSQQCLSRIERCNFYMAAIANHGELGNMKNGLIKINQHIKDEKISSAYLSLIETKELFIHFRHSEKLTLENIF